MRRWNCGLYARYGIEEHRDVLEAFPQLRVGLVMRQTYAEASADAWVSVADRVEALPVGTEVEWIHHPPEEDADDPLNLFGSWGARWYAEHEEQP